MYASSAVKFGCPVYWPASVPFVGARSWAIPKMMSNGMKSAGTMYFGGNLGMDIIWDDQGVRKFYMPYFDQEPPERDIVGLIADLDVAPSYEMDAMAVFKVKGQGYLVVHVYGCSCWPTRGYTEQVYCADQAEVDRAIARLARDADFSLLIDKCQAAKWQPRKQMPSS